eukprot:1179723-Prorocentrum_minimum.AAC.1
MAGRGHLMRSSLVSHHLLNCSLRFCWHAVSSPVSAAPPRTTCVLRRHPWHDARHRPSEQYSVSPL